VENPSAMQNKILRFIEDFSERRGMPPTVREIGGKFDIKSSTVFVHLSAWKRRAFCGGRVRHVPSSY